MKKYLLLSAVCGIAVPLYSFAISSPTWFSLTASATTGILLSWTNPIDVGFDQIIIKRSTSSYPASTMDGTLVTTWTSTSYIDTGLNDSDYYYSIFAQDLSGNTSDPTTGFIVLDTTAPTVISTTPTGGQLLPGNVPFNWTIHDDHLQGWNIYLRIAGDPGLTQLAYQNSFVLWDAATWQSITGYVWLWDGYHYRGTWVTDAFGNQTVVSSVQFQVDATKPILTQAGIANGANAEPGAHKYISATASDTHLSWTNLYLYLRSDTNFDPSDPTSGASRIATSATSTEAAVSFDVSVLATGTYYWYTQATDIVGNISSWSIQSFTISRPHRGGGGGWARATDDCNGKDKSPSFYDGLCFPDTGVEPNQRQTLLSSYKSGAVASDTGTTLTIAGFVRDVFALLGIPFHGTMPEAYTTTPVPEKLFTTIVGRLQVLFK